MPKKKKSQAATITDEFKELIGDESYNAFIQILKAIGPDARTHRIAVLFAAMLQYAQCNIHPDCNEGSLGMALITLQDDPWEINAQSEEYKMVFSIIDDICNETGMRNKRVSSRGERYSIAENAIDEYMAWYNMRWE